MKYKEIFVKHSFRIRLILTLALLIMFTIFICWFMNRTLLTKYYELKKVRTLGNVYTEVNNIYNAIEDEQKNADGGKEGDTENTQVVINEDELLSAEDEVALILERLGSKRNITVYVASFYYGNIFFPIWVYPTSMTKMQSEQTFSRIVKYYLELGSQEEYVDTLKTTDNYKVIKVFDERIGSNYMELYGQMDNGFVIYVRTNLESMQESAEVANSFLAYAGLVAIVVGIVIMYFISRGFTKPVLELSDIAKKMSHLDFNVKYHVQREDEIGTLGSSINLLSEKLEHTISELKQANNELMSDIQSKIEIDEMRKEFLSNVSHELKTPIALIQGYAEGLKENINDDDESRDFYCEVIMDEASKMNKIVKKLLSLNQIESGNNQVNIERFDIISLMKSILGSTEILFQQKAAALVFEEPEPIDVWADEFMVEEVFTNYVSNALNHVTEGGIIEVGLRQKENVLRISVYNTGEPIAQDELDNIWIKFYKVDKARTREYGGSGIGLSIVKAIMTSLNQEYGVINHDDGVEFWFELDTKI